MCEVGRRVRCRDVEAGLIEEREIFERAHGVADTTPRLLDESDDELSGRLAISRAQHVQRALPHVIELESKIGESGRGERI